MKSLSCAPKSEYLQTRLHTKVENKLCAVNGHSDAWERPTPDVGGEVDLNPMLDREVSLSGASGELRAMRGPTPPGTAVITDFGR